MILTMKAWLVFDQEKIDRVTQREPQLKPNERAMFLEIEVPRRSSPASPVREADARARRAAARCSDGRHHSPE